MDKKLLSKDNIKNVYNSILKNNQLESLPKQQKQMIVSNLKDNMKSIHKNLQTNKINNRNFNSIKNQFNKASYRQTLQILTENGLVDNDENKMAKIKYQRDFNSMPKKPIRVQERPQQLIKKKPIRRKQDNLFQQPETSLDQQFEPVIGDDYEEQDYDYDIDERMQYIQNERDNIEKRNKQRPPTPDFLKPQETSKHSKTKQMEQIEDNLRGSNQKQIVENKMVDNQNIDLDNIQSNQINGLNGYGDENYSSLNDRGTILDEDENQEFEDNTKFEDRLKKIQREREMFENNNKNGSTPIQQVKKISPKQDIYQNDSDTEDGSNHFLEKLLQRVNYLENNTPKNQELINENQQLKRKVEKYESVQDKITEEFENLNNKSKELEEKENLVQSKENKIKQLLNSYQYMLGSKFYQMNVIPDDNSSKYEFTFNEINNIISLKLISCSLPLPRYNITNQNNIILYTQDNESKELKIKPGKYDIETLIRNLNDQEKLNFELNIEQKIEIKSESNFILEKTNLLNNLGIENLKSEENKIIAEKTWDLRIPDKLLLYIRNLSDTPISILHFNGICQSDIDFENPISLEKLEIEIRDFNGELYDFSGLSHSLDFQIQVYQDFQLELTK